MPQSKELYREIRLLAIRVAKLNDGMRETACMSPEYREMIGYIKGFLELTGDHTFDSFIPMVIEIGRSAWMRTELTDLGLMLGDKKLTEKNLEDLDKELEELVKGEPKEDE